MTRRRVGRATSEVVSGADAVVPPRRSGRPPTRDAGGTPEEAAAEEAGEPIVLDEVALEQLLDARERRQAQGRKRPGPSREPSAEATADAEVPDVAPTEPS